MCFQTLILDLLTWRNWTLTRSGKKKGKIQSKTTPCLSKTNETAHKEILPDHVNSNTPSAKDLAEAGPSGMCSGQTKIVSPKDICPIPVKKSRTTKKGPKPSKAAVITASPYKLQLEESIKKMKEKEAKQEKKRKEAKHDKKEKH